MRPIERIDNFLAKVDWFKLVHRWNIDNFDEVLLNHFNKIVEYWKSNPDQRFGQVLINLGLVQDKLNIWTDEESDILIGQGIPPREVYFWTSRFDKEGNLLEVPKTKLIKDLDTEHLVAIIAWFKDRLRKAPDIITEELKFRNGNYRK